MESTSVVGESNYMEEESNRVRAVSEPINEGKEGCPKLGGRGLDSVGDTRAITKEEKEGEGDRGCQANGTNILSRGLVLLDSLLFVKVDSKPIIGEAGTYVEKCKPNMEGDNIDMCIEETGERVGREALQALSTPEAGAPPKWKRLGKPIPMQQKK
ncbi:hypothetical protein FCV25MIE_22194, partial [Fagus crenata]